MLNLYLSCCTYKTTNFLYVFLTLEVRSGSNLIDRELSGSSVVPDRSHTRSRVANTLKKKLALHIKFRDAVRIKCKQVRSLHLASICSKHVCLIISNVSC